MDESDLAQQVLERVCKSNGPSIKLQFVEDGFKIAAIKRDEEDAEKKAKQINQIKTVFFENIVPYVERSGMASPQDISELIITLKNLINYVKQEKNVSQLFLT